MVPHSEIFQVLGKAKNMKDIKYIAINLGKTGMSTEKIADVLETDIHIVKSWLDTAGVNPKDYKDQIYQRQMDGIAAAKERGVKFGRPKIQPPENFEKIIHALKNKTITAKEAIWLSGLSEATFYRRMRNYKDNHTENI